MCTVTRVFYIILALPPTPSTEEESARERQLQDELEAEGVVVAGAKISLTCRCPVSQTRMAQPTLSPKILVGENIGQNLNFD